MTPEIFQDIEQKQPGPMPVKLKLRKSTGENVVQLIAVNESGGWVATLIEFGAAGTKGIYAAKEALEIDGYDTSFAAWSERGKIILK